MRRAIIFSLSSVFFKSYFRASRSSRVNIFSQPRVMLIVDLIALAIPLVLLRYLLPRLPEEIIRFVEPLVWQALVGLPILLTSAVIVAGILFELSQASGLSSSESVNWLPISSREYVAASALSMSAVYSLFFSISMGVTLPLALEFGLMYVWPITAILSALALLLGALLVEILRASMNRVSSTVYRRSGRLGIVSRLVLLVILFVTIQLAFNPYILYYALGVMVSGVDVVWFIPMIWPSVAIRSLIRFEITPAIIFSTLSVIFTLLIFEATSILRRKYWSPTPISIMIRSSVEYIPHTPSLSRFGFSPLEASIALKDFRALTRRKDLARFIAIPIIMVIAFILPTTFTPSEVSGSSPGFFLVAFIPFMIPLMLSTITVGQEGKAVINLCMLPISAEEFIRGKLLSPWIISIIATVGAVGGFQIIAPMDAPDLVVTILAGIFVVVVESFIGLGVGSRYPDYTVGPRSRYVTFTGFLLGFLVGGASALAIFTPVALHLISSGGIRDHSPIPPFDITISLLATIIIGSTLSYLTYEYCRRGVKALISNLEA